MGFDGGVSLGKPQFRTLGNVRVARGGPWGSRAFFDPSPRPSETILGVA